MTTKGYIFMGRIAAIEGADNRPRIIAENAIPLPATSVVTGDMMAKSMVSGMGMELVKIASEALRGEFQPQKGDGSVDATGIAEMIAMLSSEIRNQKIAVCNLNKVSLDEKTVITLVVKRIA